jgi:hypothetical protein
VRQPRVQILGFGHHPLLARFRLVVICRHTFHRRLYNIL